MKRRTFVQMLCALAGLPFLPKVAARPETHTLALSEVPPHSHIPVGQIEPYAFRSDELPPGWLPCDGRVISPRHFPALAEALGTSCNPMPNSCLVKLPDINSHIALTPDANPMYDAYCGIRYMIKAR